MEKKTRLLFVQHILEQHSDENHIISSNFILEELKKHNYTATRKTIYSDIQVLIKSGVNIIVTTRGFYLATRLFELPEIRFLYDAVLSSSSLTEKKTDALTHKITSLTSKYESKEYLEHPRASYTTKQKNETIYYSIETIQRAIQNQKRITFDYQKQKYPTPKLIKYEISPYQMLWKNGIYYLIGNQSKYDTLTHFRLDCIKLVQTTKKKTRPLNTIIDKETLLNGSYCCYHINMINGGQPRPICLRCHNNIYQAVIDTFGNNISITAESNHTHFRFQAETHITSGLIGWIAQFGSCMEVISPLPLRQQMYRYFTQSARVYHLPRHSTRARELASAPTSARIDRLHKQHVLHKTVIELRSSR